MHTYLDLQAQDAVFKKCELKMNKMCNPICDLRDINKPNNNNKNKEDGKVDNINSVMALVGN